MVKSFRSDVQELERPIFCSYVWVKSESILDCLSPNKTQKARTRDIISFATKARICPI